METLKANSKVSQWWWPLVMGIIMILFSFSLLFLPIPAFLGISLFFSALILASGITNLIFSIKNRAVIEGWGWYLIIGIFEILVGLAMIFQPGLAMTTVVIFTGFWLMFRSILNINMAIELKKVGIKNWGWTLFWAILTLLFSFFILINPVIGIVSVIVLTAIPIMFLGFAAILFSLIFKNIFI